MSRTPQPPAVDRRTFLHTVAAIGGGALAAACARQVPGAMATSGAAASSGSLASFRDRIGLQLFTVRDRFPNDYPGTLLSVARIGYKEVQPTMSYGTHTLPQIKEFLDRAGLVAPTTHVSPPAGAELERTLDAYAAIGHRYTTVNLGGGRRGGGGGAPGGAPAGGAAAAGGAAPAAGEARAPRPPAARQTLDAAKRTAQQLNDVGRVTQKHGIKVIVHNHTVEFEPLADSSQRPYDVLLAETDPSLVAMELDIGWAAVAGQNALDLFRQAPGRFEVWHVKDIAGLAALNGLPSQSERQRAARIVPLGEGEIDYRPIFAQASLAGMKHFYVEQDSAPASGDSLAAAATSYRNLAKILV
ncbi:MAG TPA: TIM barrel protein [Gemmatimonadaceae bacterium]|nr:TIM barrel protein [Gemmatimonadaceae bacterium]